MRATLHLLRITVRCALATASLLAPHVHGQSANDGFDPDVNGPVHAIAVQSDGRIVIGGSFTKVGGVTRSNLARLNVDGTVDLTFNSGTDIDCLGCYQSVSALAIQADGGILVGGWFTVLGGIARTNVGRLNSNGTIDASFTADADGQVLELAMVAGGKILVAGAFYNLDGQPRTGIGRLNSNGSLDSSFNAGANETVNSLAVQPDGRILVGGDFTLLGGQTRIGIGRLNADGSLDPSFNPAAITEEMDALALQVDGKVLVGGDFTMIGNVLRAGIGRLNADGSVDNAFNPGMEGAGLHTLVVQPDGRILVGGLFTELGGQARTNIGRLNPDGSLDATFHPEVNSAVNVFSVQPDRSILVGGSFTTLGGTDRNYLGRLYPDGSLDATMATGVGGIGGSWGPDVAVIGIQPDGKILAGGNFRTLGSISCTNLCRLYPDGRPDLTFSSTVGISNSGLNFVRSALIQSDASIIVGGRFTVPTGAPANIGRLHPDGSWDVMFFPTTTTETSGMALQEDGKILVGGNYNSAFGTFVDAVRLNVDGSVDTSLHRGTNDTVQCLAVQPDGKILVGGSFSSGSLTTILFFGGYLVRFNRDGSPDETFNQTANGAVNCVALQANGQILVGGAFTVLGGQSRYGIGRLNMDGSVDTTFNPVVSNVLPGAYVRALAVQADGRIFVGGYFGRLGGRPRHCLGRVNPNGSLESTFDPGGFGVNSGVVGEVYALALQPDGKLLVGGRFDSVGGQPRARIARLTTGGASKQSLLFDASSSAITWMRSGTGPEVEHVTFEASTDGTNYTLLGRGTRVTGGWRLLGVSFAPNRNVYVRARGRAIGGYSGSSSYVVESVAQFHLNPPHINTVMKWGSAFQFAFADTIGHSYSVLATTNLAEAVSNWENLGTPVPVGNGLFRFSDPGAANHARRFYQLRSP